MPDCVICQRSTGTKNDVCQRCFNAARKIFQKLAAIKHKGGQCQECGWSGVPSGFVFHHRSGEKKDGELSRMFGTKSWALILAEIEKCDLLCARCHTILHGRDGDLTIALLVNMAGRKVGAKYRDLYLGWLEPSLQDDLSAASIPKDVPAKSRSKRNNVTVTVDEAGDRIVIISLCRGCGAEISDDQERDYCGMGCMGIDRRGIDSSLTIDDLNEMHRSMNWEDMAAALGVSRRNLFKHRQRLQEAQNEHQ